MATALPYAASFGGSDTSLFVLGFVLVMGGMILRVKFNHHSIQAEERAKDGLLNEEQARRRIAIMRYAGPVMIVLGTGAFVVLFWR